MPPAGTLIGREPEVAALEAALADLGDGRGACILVSGEAGLGKSRLVEEVVGASGLPVFAAAADAEALSPYAAPVSALRAFLRAHPGGLDETVPVVRFLRVLMPELGEAPPPHDGATLAEAVHAGILAIGRGGPMVVFLDDLHWADQATLDLLPSIADDLAETPLLLVGAYRSDELPRGHALRRVRRDLRRRGQLRELVLEPLDPAATAALAARVLDDRVAPSLGALIHARTSGIPFFVEELCAALGASGRLVERSGRVELMHGGDLPVPESVREAVLVRVLGLPDDARAALDVAAVCGHDVDLDLVAELASEDGLNGLFAAGLLHETSKGRGAFRHALTREALYFDVPWTRRRTVHRLVAERLELRRAPPLVIGEHWLAAREFHRACPALAAATTAFAEMHAYRDALMVGRRAVEAWPDGLDEAGRLTLIEEIGRCAQLAGELPEAIAAWRDVADRRRMARDAVGAAEAQRHLAVAYDLQGSLKLANGMRQAAARTFATAGRHADAAAELLAVATHLDSAGSVAAALELAEQAEEQARLAERRDLEARALGIEGTARAKLGQVEVGLATARSGLALVLDEDMPAAAVDVYQHVANAFENAGDYGAAWDTYEEAYDYCQTQGADASAQVCLVCLAAILFFTGQWDRALDLDKQILASPDSPHGVRMGAKQHFGLIAAARGDARRARRFLSESGAYASRYERQRMEVWDTMAHAWVDELEGDLDAAIERCRSLLSRFGASESVHYPAPALRWATTFLATHGAEADARACAAALARLAAGTVNPEALAALAHALGEIALLDGEPEQAAEHLERAITELARLDLPFETAQTKVRAASALVASGRREEALERLTDAYRVARKLGARPLASRVAAEVERLGEQVDKRLGRRAAARLGGPGLTRRELEIVRLVAAGRTNREIARDLFLSIRTVDMHVRNAFAKLGCRSRVEATRRASELGLLI
jgi:DNA-binding CsgD family transcriptional regulator